MMNSITEQVTSNFNRNVMPQISQQMMATGGYGGSRQGVIEANAMRDMNQACPTAWQTWACRTSTPSAAMTSGCAATTLGMPTWTATSTTITTIGSCKAPISDLAFTTDFSRAIKSV